MRGVLNSDRSARCLYLIIHVLSVLFLAPFASNAAAQNKTPPSPEKSWSPPGLDKYERELAKVGKQADEPHIEVDPDKIYDLPALIDIAERSNPRTRIAWERARQAAGALGLSQSAYFPFLVASAGAG